MDGEEGIATAPIIFGKQQAQYRKMITSFYIKNSLFSTSLLCYKPLQGVKHKVLSELAGAQQKRDSRREKW